MQNIQQKLQRQRLLDGALVNLTRFFAILVLASLGGVLLSLVIGAMPSIRTFGLDFLITDNWDTVAGHYGALAPIYGTLVISFLALIIALHVIFGIAVFLTELCPPLLRKPLGICVELLAGIPSIIYGMWGLFVFAPFFAENIQPFLTKTVGHLPVIGALFQGTPMGIGMFSAGLILAIMIIPFIASIMRDVFEVTPTMLKESAYGLGSTTWEVVRCVVLPYTKAGVVGGVILGLGRALCETMAVTFVIGNTFNISPSLFNSGVSITSALANEFAEAVDPLHLSSLLYLGLILFIITFVILVISKVMLMRIQKNEGRGN